LLASYLAVARPLNSHVDHLNTPRFVANQIGQTVWQWHQQEPFGDSPADENPSGVGTFDFPIRLSRGFADKETGTVYNYYRDSDPQLARFVQSDPIQAHLVVNSVVSRGNIALPRVMRLPMSVANPKAWWSYSYAYQSPVKYTDVFGLEVDPWCKTAPNYPCNWDGPRDDPYFSPDCCVQRCLEKLGCDRWYHWVTPTSASFCLGYYVGCTATCNVNPTYY
jgi:RHS repeat-associated protein